MSADATAVLRATRGVVQRGWTQRAQARDRDGKPVQATDPRAVTWDISAALYLAAKGVDALRSRGGFTLALAALTAACGESLEWWNDRKERTAQQVLELIDNTIEALEE